MEHILREMRQSGGETANGTLYPSLQYCGESQYIKLKLIVDKTLRIQCIQSILHIYQIHIPVKLKEGPDTIKPIAAFWTFPHVDL